jgi:hypothetical protein
VAAPRGGRDDVALANVGSVLNRRLDRFHADEQAVAGLKGENGAVNDPSAEMHDGIGGCRYLLAGSSNDVNAAMSCGISGSRRLETAPDPVWGSNRPQPVRSRRLTNRAVNFIANRVQ